MTNTLRLRSLFAMGVSTLALSAIAAPAAAATAAAAASSDNGQGIASTTLEEVIVTAEKRAVNLQDVPIAITAFTAKQRALVGITTVQDMTDFTPGLTYSSQLDRPVMRGLARNNNIYLSDSAVAVYYDDFFSNSTFLVGRDDMLVDQVEVLLGPQGTLYGRNAIGGLINTQSKRPSQHFNGEARVIVGNYGYTKVEGTVTGPLTDTLSARLSFYDLNQTRGYFNNLIPGRPSEGDVRHDPYFDVQLQYKGEKDDIWFDANALWFKNDRGGPGALLGTPVTGPWEGALVGDSQIEYSPTFPYSGGAVPGSVVGFIPGITNNPATTNIRNFTHSTPTTINVDRAYSFVTHWTHHFDGIDVKYVGGYSQYHYALHTAAAFLNDNSSITSYQIPLNPGSTCATFLAGLGCGPLTIHPQEAFTYETTTQWSSHEITLSSTNNGPIQWIAGAYYYWERDHNPETVEAKFQPQIAAPGSALFGISSLPNPSGNAVLLDYEDTIRSRAIYGQIDWKVEKNVKLTIGLRYTHDSKAAMEQTRYIGFLDIPSFGLTAGDLGSFQPALDLTTALTDVVAEAPAGAVLPRGVTCHPTLITSGKYIGAWQRCLGDTSAAATGTIGLAWTPDPDTLIYARYNRGYKAFGLDAGYIIGVPEAKPEFVNDWEVGFKKTWNRTLQIDADAFYYDYVDDQINIGVPVGGAGGPSTTVTEFINIPKAVSAGIELTANWQPVDHLALSLVYGYNYTQIKSGCSLVAGNPVGSCFVDSGDPQGLSPQATVVAFAAGKALQSPKGSQLPQAPANKIAFNANYTFVFDPGSLTVSGTYIWKDKSYASIFRRTYDEAPSWHQVDLRATWAGRNDRYEVVLYVRNLFNSLGYDAAAAAGYILKPVGGGPPTQTRYYDLTPPRTYGVEFHAKF